MAWRSKPAFPALVTVINIMRFEEPAPVAYFGASHSAAPGCARSHSANENSFIVQQRISPRSFGTSIVHPLHEQFGWVLINPQMIKLFLGSSTVTPATAHAGLPFSIDSVVMSYHHTFTASLDLCSKLLL